MGGNGVPLERTWDQWKYYGMEIGYPPPKKYMGPVEVLGDGDGVPPRCEQTKNITSRCTSYVGGNKSVNYEKKESNPIEYSDLKYSSKLDKGQGILLTWTGLTWSIIPFHSFTVFPDQTIFK